MILESLSLAERRLIIGGILLGMMVSMVLFRRSTITEVVRDKDGRIVQIVTMNQPMPIIGNWMYNTTTPVREAIYESVEVEGKRKRVERIIP